MLKPFFKAQDLKWFPAIFFLLAIGCSAPRLQPTPSVTSVSCKYASYFGNGIDPCTVTLSGPAGFGGLTVALTSSSDEARVPASIIVPIGVSSGSFNAAIDTRTASLVDVKVIATAGGRSASYALKLGKNQPKMNLSLPAISFGNVAVNSTATKTFSFQWSGSAPLTVTSANISGSGSFSLHGLSLPATIAPGQTATCEVEFTPAAAGTATGTLTFNATSGASDEGTVQLSGTGVAGSPAMSLSTSSISFGNVKVNSTASQSITVKSSGSTALAISSATITGSSNFTVSGPTLPATLISGQSATWQVKFAPASPGAVAGTLSLATNAGTNSNAAVVLSGAGVSNSPAMSLNSSSISFGDVAVQSTVTQSITAKSTGNSPLTVASAKVSGSSSFSVIGPSLPASLAPGQSATWEVEFAPAAAGAASGALAIATNSSSNANVTVALSGTGEASSPASYEVNLSWTMPSGSTSAISGYRVYRATEGSSTYALLNPTLNTTTIYTDANVTSQVTYDYYVESVNTAGISSSPSSLFVISIP